VQRKAQRCYESQSRQLKNEGEKIFPRYALYPLPTAHKWIHTALHTMCPLPSIFLDPPLPDSYDVTSDSLSLCQCNLLETWNVMFWQVHSFVMDTLRVLFLANWEHSTKFYTVNLHNNYSYSIIMLFFGIHASKREGETTVYMCLNLCWYTFTFNISCNCLKASLH